jgi:hypothetical protein
LKLDDRFSSTSTPPPRPTKNNWENDYFIVKRGGGEKREPEPSF